MSDSVRNVREKRGGGGRSINGPYLLLVQVPYSAAAAADVSRDPSFAPPTPSREGPSCLREETRRRQLSRR